ncbi:MAG: hypothetical protein A3K19_17035 [Lentisphaerae bacterium RIFOXYB12_FULL_65_16]|nr:MAG: hypothetical protein A3K18_17995 [Lentisphaerae bacterium RIFOXYA12_64_32]OGV88952.1 MAG: hypothetical protein A3K19_17035 [Lentisphaerae bacterium RIFOXYB12_FULL_65_16]
MLQNEYLKTVRELMDRIEANAAAQTDAAAEAIVKSLVAGGALYISPLGHGNDGDLLHRAGGLMAAQPFSFSFSCRDRGNGVERNRPRPEPYDNGLEQARVAMRGSTMRKGDCLVVGSVSGRTASAVSLAIAAREIGVTVIGITSLEYSGQTAAIHSAGKKVDDVSDIVVDNCVPYGDAGMTIEGLEEKAVPMSGVATTLVCWMIKCQVIEKLLARGLKPSYYISANRPDGPDFNKRMQEQFNRQGF